MVFLGREFKVIATFESVVSCAWQQEPEQALTFIFAKPDATTNAEPVVCEMVSSSSEMSRTRVIIVRDVTDRIRVEVHEAETERQCRQVAMERDDEANRFIRHEVKNGLLASLVQCDQISNRVESLGGSSVSLPELMGEMRSGMTQTLEVVLSHAVALELVHGMYEPRLEVRPHAPCASNRHHRHAQSRHRASATLHLNAHSRAP